MSEASVPFLVFQVGSERYGSPLLTIREVSAPRTLRKILNTRPHFVGVTQIRGEVVSVIDLRIRFAHQPTPGAKNAIVIVPTQFGPLGAIVDQVFGVKKIPAENVSQNRHLTSLIPDDCLLGIARTDEHLVTLIDLKRLLYDERLVQASSTERSA